jgi:hypothetical protein
MVRRLNAMQRHLELMRWQRVSGYVREGMLSETGGQLIVQEPHGVKNAGLSGNDNAAGEHVGRCR